MPYFEVDNWFWDTDLDGGQGGWRAPGTGGRSAWDMRTQAQASQIGGMPQGVGLFQYDDPQVGHDLSLGNDIEANLTAVQKSGIQTLTGARVVSDKLIDVLRELWLDHADVTGFTGWKPLVMNSRGRMEFPIRGMGLVVNERVTPLHPAWQTTIDIFQADYNVQRAVVVTAADLDQLRRQTGYQMQKMGITDSDEILPIAHRSDGFLPPTTTITETWAGGDGTTLTQAAGRDQDWTETSGDLEVRTANIGEVGQNGFGEIRCDATLAGVDHYSQIELKNGVYADGSDSLRVLTRFASGARTHYGVQVIGGGGTNGDVFKRTAGSYSSLSTFSATLTADDVWKNEINGTTLRALEDDVERDSVTDTSFSAGNQCGVAVQNEGLGGNWQAADLAAAAGLQLENIERHYPRGFARGVGRGIMG